MIIKTYVVALAEIAEILLEEGLVEKAIEKAKEGIELVHPNHAEIIKFYCIMLRAYYDKDQSQIAEDYCSKALAILDFHWGKYHPLHSTIFSILAYLLIKYKNNLPQAKTLYDASLIACTRVLGPNHLLTAEVYMDFGRLFLKMGKKEEALTNIEKAYMIYEVSMKSSAEKSTYQLANAAMQLATILEEQRRFIEASTYASKATNLYFALYGAANEIYIQSCWLAICIAYSNSSEEKNEIDLCRKLIEALEAREKSKTRNYSMDESIARIKEKCVAAVILIVTRLQPEEDKKKLLKIAEEIITDWQQEIGEEEKAGPSQDIVTLLNNDFDRVVTLSNLEFDLKSQQFLTQFYEESRQDGLIKHYQDLIKKLLSTYMKEMETTTPLENDNYSHTLAESPNEREVFKSILKALEKKNFYYILISPQNSF